MNAVAEEVSNDNSWGGSAWGCSCEQCKGMRLMYVRSKNPAYVPPPPPPPEPITKLQIETHMQMNKPRPYSVEQDSYCFKSICQSCGTHSDLRSLPIGMGIAVQAAPVEKKVETLPEWPRYKVEQDTFPLPGGLHANMRFVQHAENYDLHYCVDYQKEVAIGPSDWVDTTTLVHCYLSPTLGVKYDSRGKRVDEGMWAKAMREHFAGQHILFTAADHYFTDNWGFNKVKEWGDVVYTSPMFNNRVHEQGADYLQAKIVRVKEAV